MRTELVCVALPACLHLDLVQQGTAAAGRTERSMTATVTDKTMLIASEHLVIFCQR